MCYSVCAFLVARTTIHIEGFRRMTATQAVDRETFEHFYKNHHSHVAELCRRRFAKEQDAEDLAALVWMEVYRFFEKFHTENPRPSLYRLVNWRAGDLYRQRYRHRFHGALLHPEDESLLEMMREKHPDIGPDEKVALAQALQHEEAEDRQLLFGRFVEGLSWAELATRHGIHRNTALKRIKLSLHRLRKHLEVLPSTEAPT